MKRSSTIISGAAKFLGLTHFELLPSDISDSSCGFDLGKPPSIENIKVRYCNALNRQKPFTSPNALLDQCKKTLSEECKKCLGIK